MRFANSLCHVVIVLLVLRCCASQFASIPTELILGAPFRVTSLTPTSVVSVIVTTSDQCSGVVSSPTLLVSLSAVFHLPESTSNTLFLCDSATNTLLRRLDFIKIVFSPQYLVRLTPTLILFSSATPAGSRIQFREFSDCVSGVPASEQTLTSSKTITVTVSSTFYYFICVQFVSPATSQTVTVNVGQLLVNDPMFVTPQTAITNEQQSYEISGAAAPYSRIKISSFQNCSDVALGPFTASGTFGKTITMRVTLPRGSYTFCIEYPQNLGIFQPISPFHISQYAASPRTLFSGRAATITLGLDSPLLTSASFSLSATCSPPFVISPIQLVGGTTFSVIIPTVSVVYSCLRKSNSQDYIAASEHIVVVPYTVTLDRTAAVRGLSLLITTQPHPTILLKLAKSGGGCTDILATSNAVNNMWNVVVPLDASLGISSAAVCAETVDGSAVYELLSFPLRSVEIYHEVLVAGRSRLFTVDSSFGIVSTTTFKFSSSSSCGDPAQGLPLFNALPLSRYISFPTATTSNLVLCVQTAGYFVPVSWSITVYPVTSFTPNSTLATLSTRLTVHNISTGITVVVSSSCSDNPPEYSAVLVGSAQVLVLQLLVVNERNLVVCALLHDSTGTLRPESLGVFRSSVVSSSPTNHFQQQLSRLSFGLSLPALLLPVDESSTMFLSPSGNCDFVQGTVGRLSRGANGRPTATFTAGAVGTVSVCAGSPLQGHVVAGILKIIPRFTIVLPYSTPLQQLPLNISFGQNGGDFSTKFFFLSSTANCSASITGGTVNSFAQTSLFSVSTAGTYTVCVASDDDITFMPTGVLTLFELQATQTTYMIGLSMQLKGDPVPSAATLALSSNVDCSAPRYSATLADALRAPPGVYFLCALMGSAHSVSSNKARVISAFQSYVPVEVKSFVPFNITLSAGDVPFRNAISVFFVAQPDDCATGTAIGAKTFTATNSPSTVQVTIFAKEETVVTLCVISADGTLRAPVVNLVPKSSMSPQTVLKGSSTSVRSGTMSEGLAKISSAEDCSNGVDLAVATPISSYQSMIFVPTSITAVIGYYCESANNGASFAYRGKMSLIEIPVVPPGSTLSPLSPIGFESRWIPPATPFELYVHPTIGKNPFVSRFANCSGSLPQTMKLQGYIPSETEVSSFFVCATSPDGSLIFTTQTPTLHVFKYTMANSSGCVPAGIPTRVFVSPALPEGQTSFLSYSSMCNSAVSVPNTDLSTSVGSAVVLPSSGIVFVCFGAPASSLKIRLVSFLAAQIPNIVRSTQKIEGVPYCFTRSVPSNVYSVVPGEVTSQHLKYSPYFISEDRSVFLVPSGVSCVDPNAHLRAILGRIFIPESTTMCLNTLRMNGSVNVCTGTAAGFQLQEQFSFSQPHLPANVVVSDSQTVIQFSPGIFNQTFGLFHTDACTTSVTPPFFVDSHGIGTLLSVPFGSTAGQVPPGRYVLCLRFVPLEVSSFSSKSTALESLKFREANVVQWFNVSSIFVVTPKFYSISSTTFVAGIPTFVSLLQDLTTAVLRPNISTTPSCADAARALVSSGHGATTTATITLIDKGQYFICASTPVNNSVVPVAKVISLTNPIQFSPSTSACSVVTFGFLTTFPATRLVVFGGHCCSSDRFLRPDLVVVEASATSTNLIRTATIDNFLLEKFAPQTLFQVCLWNDTSCLYAGPLSVTSSNCRSTPVPQNQNAGNSSSSDRGSFASAATSVTLTSSNYMILIVLSAVFFVLLVIVLVIVVLCCCVQNKRVVPVDPYATASSSVPAYEWTGTFDQLMAKERNIKDPTTLKSILHVPINLHLEDDCYEAPVAFQALAVDEERFRVELLQQEEVLWDNVTMNHLREVDTVKARGILADRTLVQKNLFMYLVADLQVVNEQERVVRVHQEEMEDQCRLQLLETERECWRKEMEKERARLQVTLESDPFWRSRRRLLREANLRAMQSVSESLDAGVHQETLAPSNHSARTIHSGSNSTVVAAREQVRTSALHLESPPRPRNSNVVRDPNHSH